MRAMLKKERKRIVLKLLQVRRRWRLRAPFGAERTSSCATLCRSPYIEQALSAKEACDDQNQDANANLLALVVGSIGVTPAAALTTKECSAKYQAAKSAGTLGGKTWNEFRKAECAASAAPPRPKAPRSLPLPKKPRRKPPSRNDDTLECRFPHLGVAEIRERFAGYRPPAYVPRSVPCQQSDERQWRLEVDHEGRRLLQRMQ